jgi:hypothetical protein
LVRESGATSGAPIYVFQDLTPESILEEIWYGSQGLHLIGAPICVFLKKKNLVRLGQSHFSTRPEPNNTQQVIPSWMEHLATSPKQEDLVDLSSLAKHSVAANEDGYQGYHVSWTQQKGTGAYQE